MSTHLIGVTVTALAPETLTGLPYPHRSLEIGFPLAAIQRPDGRHSVGPLLLRTSPVEAAVLALRIHDTITAAAMAEARRLHHHGRTTADTGVLTRVLDGLRDL